MVDDLINKGTNEPYRMFTSRAEYRILLRQDNSDIRLSPLAKKMGVKGMDERMERVAHKVEAAKLIEKHFRNTSISPDDVNEYLTSKNSSPIKQKMKLHSILTRPHINVEELRAVLPSLNEHLNSFDNEFVSLAEINMKYEGYIKKEEEMVQKMNRLEEVKLREDMDYHELVSLSSEAREKLTQLKPMTIGQASRISGVSPSDISVLLVHLGR